MIISAWIFAYGITNVVAMVTNLNGPDSRFQLRMDELNDYMDARELPMQLRYEIRELYFNARISAESKLVNEGKILAELSACGSKEECVVQPVQEEGTFMLKHQ
ncbi:hypothetical protein PR003_g5192 [Phytophthora rubi]|uniref:Cyclic nucleotide-binding domain-containing protein n=1 Tax=Phytophthora rubi TaxID=129364 RepID=A0A6A3KTW9_9STRA|nr:hypothetical protein PR002_g15771 [Phytophthora rubi]KAE9350800.1 hypothetical protein PR003_g5192 [Phytophthora rubi]